MNNQVCFQSNHFVFVVVSALAVIVFALWQVNQQANQIRSLKNEQYLQEHSLSEKLRANEIKQDQMMKMMLDKHKAEQIRQVPIEIDDYQRMNDPLIPPLKRDYLRHQITSVNFPTRGEYDTFQQVGYAYKNNQPDQMVGLFGRRIHSNKYEYYVIHPLTQIKIPIRVKNDWELNRGDKITITGYPGDFQVELYDLDYPRYF